MKKEYFQFILNCPHCGKKEIINTAEYIGKNLCVCPSCEYVIQMSRENVKKLQNVLFCGY